MSRLNNQLHDTMRTLAEKNAELARLNAQVNRLMGIAAHDLRNPLAVIMMHGEFLRQDLAPTLGADQRESIEMIEGASAFMKRLLDDLLDVSQIRAGKLRLDLRAIDLAAFVGTVVQLNRGLAARKQIEIRFTAPAGPVEMAVDSAKIQQLINNLVGNAIQYSMPGSLVDVSVTSDTDEIRIVVRDHGKGIAEAEVAKVFRPFETTSTRGTAGEKSTGLGLAIVQSIAEGHGGSVWVESRLGEGSTFFVAFPRS